LRIGIASDSQGDTDALERALDVFARVEAEGIWFLGDRSADVDEVLSRRRRRAAAAAPAAGERDDFLEAVRGALARQPGVDPLAGRIVRVASRACPGYASGALPAKHVDLVEGTICCLVHDTAELSREDIENATVLFHGKSARAAIVRIGPRLFVTPGRLRAGIPGAEASFAVVEMSGHDLALTVYSAAGAALREERAPFGAGGRMSVK
jgi:predicted phosphodiesterase